MLPAWLGSVVSDARSMHTSLDESGRLGDLFGVLRNIIRTCFVDYNGFFKALVGYFTGSHNPLH